MVKWLTAGIVLAAILGTAASLQETRGQTVTNWKRFPVPYGTPETRRPPDSEFLKMLPPLRPEPVVDAKTALQGFAPWWGDYSVQFFSENPPSQADLTRKPVVRTIPGDDEPLVLGLWGIEEVGSVKLSVRYSPFPVTIRCVEYAPRLCPRIRLGYVIPGARVIGFPTYMPLQDSAQVKPKANTVFWMTVETPASAKPGLYTGTLDLMVEKTGKHVALPLNIRVLPIKLPEADIAFGLYFRPFPPNIPDRYTTPQLKQMYWKDMARHGMNSCTLYNRAGNIFDAKGMAAFDSNRDIAILEEWLKVGLARPKIPIMFMAKMNEKASPNVVAEIEKRGFPEFLIYGPDEPKVNQDYLGRFNKLQPLRKYFRIVTAISDRSARRYADMLDVWTVDAGTTSPSLMKLAAEKKAEMWNYDVRHRHRANAPWSRYYAGLYTWGLGLKGNFLWCYTEDFYWEEPHSEAIYCFVLPSDNGPVPSVEWEARREGVEDYRTLRMLEQLVARKPGDPVAQDAARWLAQTKSRVDWYLARNMPPSVNSMDGVELYPMCPNFDQTELSGIRTKAQEYILKLASK